MALGYSLLKFKIFWMPLNSNDSLYPELCIEGNDHMVWTPDPKGVFSVASAYENIRCKTPIVSYHKQVWNHYIHPRVVVNAWKLCKP
ncbi:hypothetical protein IFM89_034600 [Coptis chinensis]|uniref:Uncharacterized protein n=1 Tax=Coptis chinensis TaxID=261450 RepID=A0A835HS59_9MAGN|nr:hypothetical protein IFM89_034600 [Coptis chinensis]